MASLANIATKLSMWDGVSFTLSKTYNYSSSGESTELGEKSILPPVENNLNHNILSSALKSISTPSSNKVSKNFN